MEIAIWVMFSGINREWSDIGDNDIPIWAIWGHQTMASYSADTSSLAVMMVVVYYVYFSTIWITENCPLMACILEV